MDAYLEIAREILRLERRPLSARAILASAYKLGLMPVRLHGRTQHKTLGARLSEDIVTLREGSMFYRYKPGRFFLREFLADESIPEEFRQPIATRRRVRELIRGPALAFEWSDLHALAAFDEPIPSHLILDLLKSNRFCYDDPRKRKDSSVLLWSFVSVRRQWELLAYRLGRYRDDRDTFMCRRSIGFTTLVDRDQRSLFSLDDFGIVDSGVNAARIDLDVPDVRIPESATRVRASLKHFVWVTSAPGFTDLLAVVDFECPNWFHPERRRLALNDVSWLDSRVPLNNIDDFEPWSRSVLSIDYETKRYKRGRTHLWEDS